jgi:hypothetical protein
MLQQAFSIIERSVAGSTVVAHIAKAVILEFSDAGGSSESTAQIYMRIQVCRVTVAVKTPNEPATHKRPRGDPTTFFCRPYIGVTSRLLRLLGTSSRDAVVGIDRHIGGSCFFLSPGDKEANLQNLRQGIVIQWWYRYLCGPRT